MQNLHPPDANFTSGYPNDVLFDNSIRATADYVNKPQNINNIEMHDFVLIREYRAQDKAQCDDVVKNYLMECSREAFMTVLFKEVS